MATGASAALLDGTDTPGSWAVSPGSVNAVPAASVPLVWSSVGGDWIGANPGGVSGVVPTDYTYTQVIDTTGYINVSITFTAWQDDLLIGSPAITGGGSVANVDPFDGSFLDPSTWTITAVNNQAGQTLSIVVRDGIPTYTGLRVDVTNISKTDMPGAVPEPSTYALVGLGLAALALIRRRRNA
jgi:PEP-CTERM motif-containing protein